jgi:zinc protease
MTTATSSVLRADRLTLSNGLPVLHNRATSNPSVVVRALVRAGASRETADHYGLASITGRMLRQGTAAISKEALAEELDGMGAGLSVDVGYSLAVVSIKCLSEDFGRAMQIVGEVLQRPTFPAEELEKVRGQVLTDLRELDDNTRVVAERLWRQTAYPQTHRYHQLVSGTLESVADLTRDDLVAFHGRWYGSNQTSLTVVGDVDLATARDTAEKVFGTWPRGDPEQVESSLPATERPTSQLRELALAGKTQADVALGTPTLSRTAPDYYALAFANHILGRIYFMGRFGEKVRDEQGLAYYAYSELHGGFGRGPWLVRAGVNPRNLEKALASIRAELERFLAEGPTEAEQADGVMSLIGSLPRQLESNEGVAAVLGEIELYDLGLDYLDRYPSIIRSLTHAQVLEAARRWLQPDSMTTAIAGPARESQS